jgi:hypothetical protein
MQRLVRGVVILGVSMGRVLVIIIFIIFLDPTRLRVDPTCVK